MEFAPPTENVPTPENAYVRFVELDHMVCADQTLHLPVDTIDCVAKRNQDLGFWLIALGSREWYEKAACRVAQGCE